MYEMPIHEQVGRYKFTEYYREDEKSYAYLTNVQVQECTEDFVLEEKVHQLTECPYSFLGFGKIFSSFSTEKKFSTFDPKSIMPLHFNKYEYHKMQELKLDTSYMDKVYGTDDECFACTYIVVLEDGEFFAEEG